MINIVKTNLSVQLGDIIYDINMINMINIDKTNLSVQWGDGVDCAKLSTCGDDIVALLAVASYLDFDQGQFVIAMMMMMSIIFMHPRQKDGDVFDAAITIRTIIPGSSGHSGGSRP